MENLEEQPGIYYFFTINKCLASLIKKKDCESTDNNQNINENHEDLHSITDDGSSLFNCEPDQEPNDEEIKIEKPEKTIGEASGSTVGEVIECLPLNNPIDNFKKNKIIKEKLVKNFLYDEVFELAESK